MATSRKRPVASAEASFVKAPSTRAATRSTPPAGAAALESASTDKPLRMRDLVRLTGLPRETIHFYLTQGLLPKPVKTGRNTAVYDHEHLDRLQRIKDLQERHFLPLRAIKAVLEEGTGGAFSDEQQAMLRRVRASQMPSSSRGASQDVALTDLVPSKISRADFDELKRLGLVDVKGRGRDAAVSSDDARILECWAAVGKLLEPDVQAMTPDVLATYGDAMDSLVEREARVLTRRYSHLSGERAAELIEASEPVVLQLLAAFRRKKIAALLEGALPPRN
jgi:DNA-binding transcriptional MerR regulator